MIVALVYRTGGDYFPAYVERLVAAVDHDVVCLTDAPQTLPSACSTVPLQHNWPGWWSKVELFRPGLWGDAHVLYLDLDSVVLSRDLSHMARDNFTMLKDFFFPARPASGVMAWRGGAAEEVYTKFRATAIKTMALHRRGGDGAFIADLMKPRSFFGDSIQSAKVAADRSLADVVCFHGKPRPHHVDWDFTRVPTRRKAR